MSTVGWMWANNYGSPAGIWDSKPRETPRWSASYGDGWGTFSSPCWVEAQHTDEAGWRTVMENARDHGLEMGCAVTVQLAEEQLAKLAGGPLLAAANMARNTDRRVNRGKGE